MIRINLKGVRTCVHASFERWHRGFLKIGNQAPSSPIQQSMFGLVKILAFPQFLFAWVLRYHLRLSLFLLSVLVFVIGLLVLRPYESMLRANLALRPAQWAHLYSLVSSVDQNEMVTVAQFTHEDMQKLHAMGISRGIPPNSFLLTSTTSVTISIQSNGIAFSALMELLEQMRMTWHIYPTDIRLESTSVPGTVNVTGNLMQYPILLSSPHKMELGR